MERLLNGEELTVKKGRELNQEEWGVINRLRRVEFGAVEDLTPDESEEEENWLFLKATTGEVLAIGRLSELRVRFEDKEEELLFFSTVIASKKGKGYGRRMMEAIKERGQREGRTVIGFCETDLLPFYEAVGFEIVKAKDNRFVYIDAAGKELKKIVPGEVIYSPGRDGFMERVLSSKSKRVEVYRK